MNLETFPPPLRLLLLATVLFALGQQTARADARQTIDLDGDWQIAQGQMDAPPASFDHRVPVPGLVDMAQPAFDQVGVKSPERQAFWYRRVFHLDGPVPAVATLRIGKAFFGVRVYLNGKLIGEHLPLFTAGSFDVHDALKGQGVDNELVVRVGANPDAIPDTYARANDFEKTKWIPGIFDTVTLVLSGTPSIVRVQAAPDIKNSTLRVQAAIHNAGPDLTTPLTFLVKEARSGVVVHTAQIDSAAVPAGQERTFEVTIPIAQGHLWSPEDPFLYTLDVATQADQLSTRFGMREFHFDATTGRAYLNGRLYHLRGSNITIYRFFEDAERGALPWDRAWVQKLHHSFKQFHWNSLRYCIGYPPDFWYDIADEEGILLQDEFPIWDNFITTPHVTSDELARELTEHMQDHWNHPSVALWDAQNETSNCPEIGEAIQKVRPLDLSGRPWDNGWGGLQEPTDSLEGHPYHYLGNTNTMRVDEVPPTTPPSGAFPLPMTQIDPKNLLSVSHPALIINEYGGIWLQRNGLPPNSTKAFYDHLLGPNATVEQYRETYARYMAAETEYFRAYRVSAAVLEFCALGYSRPDGVTSDHFIDVKNLVYDPVMAEAYRNAFAPVGLMLDYWEGEVEAGKDCSMPVAVVNDLAQPWEGMVTLTLHRDGMMVRQLTQAASVEADGTARVTFQFKVPDDPGIYDLRASIPGADGQTVVSRRNFQVLTAEQRLAKDGLPVVKATASSEFEGNGIRYLAAYAVDHRAGGTRWASDNRDPQWLEVDLGTPQTMARVELSWEAASAKSYRIQVSSDEQNWTDVYQTTEGKGGVETVKFTPVTARWVRMYGTERNTVFGYSLWEFRIFPD